MLPLLSVAQNESRIDSESIINSWKIRKILTKSDTTLQLLSPKDQFIFTEDGEFHISLQNKDQAQTGKWQFMGDSVFLYFEFVSLQTQIDSIVYSTLSAVSAENVQEPAILYYYEGKEVARQTSQELISQRRKEAYQLQFISSSQLILKGKDKTYELEGKRALITSDFSITDIFRGLIGIIVLLGFSFLLSEKRTSVDWKLVGTGIGLQIMMALLILKVPGVKDLFEWIANGFSTILNFTLEGSEFLFGGIVKDVDQFGYIFAFQVLPVIVFFSALMSVFYYAGILQKIVYGFAWLMNRTMRLSGSESLSVAGNIFMGQTEAPLLVKPYLEKMTRSEMMLLMTGGMATIAGSVYAAYIGYLGGDDPVQRQLFATHLLSASIISAPASIVISKMIVPEKEKINREVKVPRDHIGTNLLDAISNGTRDGLRLAVNVAVMLLVFIALISLVNYLLTDKIGEWTGLNEYIATSSDGTYEALSLEVLLGWIFAPIAWIIGVPAADMIIVGQFLGEKMIINEFVAYVSLGEAKEAGNIIHFKSVIIATYALCGFANFASIGIQIGGIGALAPGKQAQLAALGLKAMLGGTLAAFMTASVAGMLINI